MARSESGGCSTEENHRSGEEELTGEGKVGEGDGVRAPASDKGDGVRAPANGDEGSGCGALETAKKKSAKERKKERNCSGPLFMGGIPERFPFFPPTISTIVGGICFVPRATWHYPERPIRPHRGPHGPNGWIPDRMRLPGAGTQATAC